MNRIVSGLKRFAELYLIIVGGAYALAALVALVLNTRTLSQTTDKGEIETFRGDINENCLMLIPSALILVAGVGVRRSRLWGLILALGMAVLVIAYSLVQNAKGISDYHDFTVALPMAVIFLWGILPPTWLTFKRLGVKPS
jgi:peptidoglycan/LPS O-acetylase OafA/YrhL